MRQPGTRLRFELRQKVPVPCWESLERTVLHREDRMRRPRQTTGAAVRVSVARCGVHGWASTREMQH